MNRLTHLLICAAVLQSASVFGADWVRAGLNTNQPVWGIRGGLLWAVAPAGFRGGEPRGLIRLGYPVLPAHAYDLINFIAIEPIVGGRRGFSELEQSKTDGLAGKWIWCKGKIPPDRTGLSSGTLDRTSDGAEQLQLDLHVEKFENGAHVRLVARQRSDKPDELELSVFKEDDSQPLDCCILTATMGNMARTRRLWLKNRVVTSQSLYPTYKDKGFARHEEFGLPLLTRKSEGDVLVAVTTDETNPASIYPFPRSELWHYAGEPVTQFWRMPSDNVQEDLRAVVNGRYMYWGSQQPVPGGVAFENFELRERFRQGQTFIFGITHRTPAELGL